MSKRIDAIIVGAGLAGLSCAHRLRQAGLSPVVLEASDGVGGRVRTDEVEGFLLDRGFQTFLEPYPEARRILDYGRLRLRRFQPAALVRFDGRFHRVSDPFRMPWNALEMMLSPLASFPDKLRVAKLSLQLMRLSPDEILRGPETSTLGWLKRQGFSETIIRSLFIPFIGGIFLERELRTSSVMFEYVFQMMSRGYTSLPSAGMGAIPNQIASLLPPGSVQTGQRVRTVKDRIVTLVSGARMKAEAVVVAAEGPSAARLLGIPAPTDRSASCIYFAAERSPLREPVLLLDGEGRGPVNSLCVLSDIAPTYAPAGSSLISAAIPDTAATDEGRLLAAALDQLREWFGNEVRRWRHLRTYRISHARPEEISVKLCGPRQAPRFGAGIYVCGDHLEMPTINGALLSGRRAAECVISDLS